LPNRPARAEIKNPAAGQERLHPWRGYFFIAAATFCWGAAATAGKAVFQGSLFAGRPLISPVVLSQTRTSFAVLVLAAFLGARHGARFFRIRRRDLALCVAVGTLGLAGSNFFYYLAIQYSTVAIAITLQYTAPVWVLLWMVLGGRERLSMVRVLSVGLAMVGIALTIGLHRLGAGLNLWGAGAAMLASVSFAFYNIVAQRLVARNHHLRIMLYVLLSAAVFWLVIDPPWRLAAQNYSVAQWGFLFLFACCSTLLPYVFFFSGLKYLDPTRAVIAACLEPVFAVLFAAAFVHEGVGWLEVLGILAVLAGTVIAQVGAKEGPLPEVV
jgi:drug/metabolite transporter (DMT)-like permease